MAAKREEVLIIGGGIGGLAAALALRRVGVEARVFEQAPELREAGAGLGLWSNAVRALDELGMGGRIRRLGMPLRIAEICSSKGDVLSRLDLEKALRGLDAANYVMHRADLHGALVEALPEDILETGARCVSVAQDERGARAYFADREPAEGALLVGADGLQSAVRASLWEAEGLRYSGQTCYRGIAETPPPEPGVIREVQGAGKRAAVCPMDGGRVYWWAALNAPFGEKDDPAQRQEHLLKEFQGWPYHIPEMIEATEEAILRNDLVDRAPLSHWTHGRVTLLGDAAHPMLPNLGQGACTAIEDGLVLAQSIATYGFTPQALSAYERERIERTTQIVRQSWAFGIPVRWEHPLAVALREWVVRLLPKSLLVRALRQQVGFDVGSLPVAAASA